MIQPGIAESASRADSHSVDAYALRCEHRDEPLGIDVGSPRLSWRLRSSRRGARPVSHRVVVRESHVLDDGSHPVWDSGWRTTGENAVVLTAGLRSSTRYRWTVSIRDDLGAVTQAESWFETALLHSDELTGEWVTIDPIAVSDAAVMEPPVDDDLPTSMRQAAPPTRFRTEFALGDGIAAARLHVTAKGVYRAFANGRRVGLDELTPGWTDYRDRILYQTYDVTDLVAQGANALALEVADGWWAGRIGFDTRQQALHYGTTTEVWALLIVRYADGTETRVQTGPGWRCGRGDIDYADLLMGERQDARRATPGWSLPGFDDGAWTVCRTSGDSLDRLVAQVDEPIRATQVVPATLVRLDAHGRTLVDFGQNLVGRLQVDLPALPAGTTLRFRHGETLEDGALYTANLRTAEATDVYLSDGSPATFEPRYTLHGYRYAEISGLPAGVELRAQQIRSVVLHNDIAFEHTLSTSSDDVNTLLSNIRWGQRGNFVAVPTDCPQRDERLGWMADAQVFLPTAAANASVESFFTRWLRDVRYAQTPEGSFRDVAPAIGTFFGDGAPAWADAGVIIPWELYRLYGDERVLAESFDSMRRWIDFLERENPGLLWLRRTGNAYGDWLQIDAETPRDLLATAYFARSARIVADTASVLGRTDEAQRYGSLADGIAAAFTDTFLQSDGRLAGDTQTAYLLALAFELLPEAQVQSAAAHLVRTIEAHGRLLTTGFVGVALICPTLTRIGRGDLALALLETDEYPSWLYSVRQGATTIWERWDGWTEHDGFQSVEMNSFNHYSLGSVGQWLLSDVAGIDQGADSVGYAHLRLEPLIGGSLTSVTAGYESPRGLIRSDWTLRGDRITWEIEIPPGVEASVLAPTRDTTIDGTPAEESPVASDVAVTGRGTRLRLASGTYVLEGLAVTGPGTRAGEHAARSLV